MRRLLLLLVVPLALAAGSLPNTAAAAPNVLIIVTDDQRLDRTMVAMPKTKQWFWSGIGGAAPIQGGTYFPKAVANTPWCCPARASIFTGQYSHNHGITAADGRNFGTTEAAPHQQQTLQAYLKQATPSYRTAIFGKYLNGWGINCEPTPGDPAIPPPFFDEYQILGGSYSPTCINDNGTEQQSWRHSTLSITEKAVDFLDRVGSQPWFLYLAPITPHEPFTPEAKYADASVPGLNENDAFFEEDRRDKPPWLREKETDFDADYARDTFKDYQRMLMSADDMVDTVMRKLREIGQDDNTIAFFTSDNGYQWGEHGASAKPRPYFASLEVPFFMRWPGWPGHSGNEIDRQLVGLVDIAPTVLDAVGITPASGDLKDGRSLLSTANPRKRIFTELAGGRSKSGRWGAVLTPDLHYIETYGINDDDTTDYSDVFREYYDLTRDPRELTNLLGDNDLTNDPPIQQLAATVASDRACAGATCPRGGEQIPLEARITRGAAESDISGGSISDDPATSGFLSGDFYFTSSEPRSRFECRLEALNGQYGSQEWNGCLSPTTVKHLVNGAYRFSVRAIDPDNSTRQSPIATYQWTVAANPAPDTRIVVAPPRRANSQTAWFSFASSKPPSAFKCKLDASPAYQPCATVTSFNVADTAENAPHTLQVVATALGGDDPTPAVFRWSVDSTPLSVDALTADAPTFRREAKFTFGYKRSTASTEADDLPSRFECKLDDEAYEPCGMAVSSNTWRRVYPDLAPGPHDLSVRVYDQEGNVSAPVTHHWTVGQVSTFRPTPDTRWPDIAGSEVRSVVPDGCGGWYVGGLFTGVGAAGGFSNLAHIKSDKSADLTWRPIVAGGGIETLLLSSSKRTLYVGGRFTSVNGVPRNRLAAVATPLATDCSAAAGNSVTGWDPDPNNDVYALKFATTRNGGESYVYAGGAFSMFNGASVTRRKLAQLRTADTGTVVESWDPGINNTATVRTVAVNADSVWVGAIGMTTIGGAERNDLAEISAVDARATSWNPDPDGGVLSLRFRRRAIIDDVIPAQQLPSLFVGGDFTRIGNPPRSRPGAAEVATYDDGGVTPWNPSIASGGATYDFLPITGYNTILGGAFTAVTPGARLAETDRFTGAAVGWDPRPSLPVFDLDYVDPVAAVGGAFDTVGPTPVVRRKLAFFCRMDAPTTSGPCS